MRLLVASSQQGLTARIGEIHAHIVIVGDLPQVMKRLPPIGRSIDAEAVVDAALPKHFGIGRVIDDPGRPVDDGVGARALTQGRPSCAAVCGGPQPPPRDLLQS